MNSKIDFKILLKINAPCEIKNNNKNINFILTKI